MHARLAAARRLFERYRTWLNKSQLHAQNLLARDSLALASPQHDFIVIDELRGLTPLQLALVLAFLKKPGQSLPCGRLRPNRPTELFFVGGVRALFWLALAGDHPKQQGLHMVHNNFRNAPAVTHVANGLHKVKQAQFDSIDRESNFLVRSASIDAGQVRRFGNKDATLRELNASSRASVRPAVVVLKVEDKAAVRQHFRTRLVFCVHQARGFEYPHDILYELVSGHGRAFEEGCQGVQPADLEIDD